MSTLSEAKTNDAGVGAAERPWALFTPDEGDFDDDKIFVVNEHRIQNNVVPIATIGIGFEGRVEAEQHANAALIVAAVNSYHPERDALLVEMEKALESIKAAWEKDGSPSGRWMRPKEAERWLKEDMWPAVCVARELLTHLRATQAKAST